MCMPSIIKKNKSSHKEKKYIQIILMCLIFLSFIFIRVLSYDLLKNKKNKLEEEMINLAKEYVNTNHISTDKEIYLDFLKLKIDFNDNCSLISGVIYDGENYYPNLICNDYQSKVIKTNKKNNFIALNGDEIIVLAYGMKYYDPGYISEDIVEINGEVGSEEGVYNLYYKAINSNVILNRKVIIIDNQEIRNLFPVIALNGEDSISLIENSEYNELGAIGYDVIDGNITNQIKIISNVNNTISGNYLVSYSLTNSRGYNNTIVREVRVLPKEKDLVINYTLNTNQLTNEDIIIKLNIVGNYKKIVYPNGLEGTSKSYVVKENGLYKFIISDYNDKIFIKEIEVNNIYKKIPEGSCIATIFHDKTEIKVNVSSSKEISQYEYYLNGNIDTKTQSNTYISSIINPSIVKVKIIDIVNNQNNITCTLVDKKTREIVTDSEGKNCLEGLYCYVQYHYANSKYPFCSKSNNPNTCGGIGRSGCSITSVSTAIAAMGVKNKNGIIHNPHSVWEELYPINKYTGECNDGCSAWSRIRDTIINAGLSAPKEISYVNESNLSIIKNHLKKGYPVIVRSVGKPYSIGAAHYLTLLGIRDDGYVFLSDSANTSGIIKDRYQDRDYYVDTWIPIMDLITGNIEEFLLIGPLGMFEEK